MKICHYLSSSTFAGIEQHVYELAKYQNNTHEVTILCNEDISENYRDFNVICLKNSSRRSIFNFISVFKILKSNKFDIVHAHASKPVFVLSKLKSLIRFNFIASIHGSKSNTSIFNYADYVIGGNKKQLDEVTSKKSVVTNWYSISTENKEQGMHAIAVGRLEKVKGFDQLIKSWVNIRDNLEIIGSGPEAQKLTQLINDLNLADRIKILTNFDYNSIESKYKTASGLIVSSHREGGPRVLLEAINHEIPVLGSSVGMIPDLIPAECLSEPGNQESLQALLEEMVPLLPQLNMEGIKAALVENYSLMSAAKKTQEIYEALLKASS